LVSESDPESLAGLERPSNQAWAIIQSRLATIERGLASANDDAPRREARREAHMLAGSLDMLGLPRAGDLAGELERLLETGDPERRGPELAKELRREVEQHIGRPPSGGEDESVPTAAQSAKILIADDDEIMAKMIVAALQRQGYQVLRARDGAEAVEMTAHQRFDLILLDLQMPVMDGFAACRAMRSDPRLADVPILLVTAQSNERRVRDRRVEGASDYLIKPFAVAELRARVRTWLSAGPGETSA
jgi:CheY-like chemotaxis protein